MKKVTIKTLLSAIFLFSALFSFSQSNEKQLRELLKKDGLSELEINDYLRQKKEEYDWTQTLKGGNPPPSPFAACSDLGVENGWSAWTAQTSIGTYTNTANVNWNTVFNPTTNPNPRFVLTTGTGNAQCVSSSAVPGLKVVAPGFGTTSIKLGTSASHTSERITFPLTVTPQDTNFIYAHAIVIQDPGHLPHEQPFASLCIYDQNNNPVPCGCFTYTSVANSPGWYQGTCTVSWYKPWTVTGINLANYVGQTLTVEIKNVDCALGAHFVQSYWDFACSVMNVSVPSAGCGGQVTLCAPTDPLINYTYQWTQNGNPYTGAPSATAQCITPYVVPGDTFVVEVIQPSGCNFKMVYAPQVSSGFTASVAPTGAGCNSFGTATANVNGGVSPFNYQWSNGQNSQTATGLTAGNYTVVITDAQGCTATSTVTISGNMVPPTASAVSTPVSCTASGTATANASGGGGAPYNYAWSNGQTTQTTTGLQVGNYTVTVTDASGCTAVTTVSVTSTAGFPAALFSSGPVCLGVNTQFNDQSTGSPNTWNWNFGDGSPASSLQSPSHTYATPGTYTVTLIVSSSGCSDTTTNIVTVHPTPQPNFSAVEVCEGNPTDFTDLSTISSGSIIGWSWNFGGTGTSTQQNPTYTFPNAGTYNVNLAVASNNGCTNSFSMQIIVHGSPSANFCVTPEQQLVTNPVFAFCDLWSNDVTQWAWDFGDGNTNTFSTDPVHSYSANVSGNEFYHFNICLNVQNQYGCWDTVCKTVELIPEFTFYIPNAFTPNGDFSNEFFFGKSRGVKEYKIWIFDRWGNMVWDCSRDDVNATWDAQSNEGLSSACKWNGIVEKGGADMNGGSNQPAQQDVYVWKVELTDIFDKEHNYVGHVSIVR